MCGWSLAPLTDPDLIPHLIASTLGMRAESSGNVTGALVDFLRPRTTLLLLDNCERVIAACALLADQILRVCPRVRILATSREALAVTGERAWRVPSLALPTLKPGMSADVAARSDAVTSLSIARTPSLRNSADTGDHADCGAHLPATGRHSVGAGAGRRAHEGALGQQIAARLDDRFQLLTGGSRTAVPRQQTLRATIDWSYDLLSEDERRLLRRLSVFAGGSSLEAVEQVCGIESDDNNTMRSSPISSTSRSLPLTTMPQKNGGTACWRPTAVRTQSAIRKRRGRALRDRHFQFFERLALDAEDKLTGPDQVAWASRLAADHDNLRAALEWGLATSGNGEAPLRMVCALWSFWNQRNHFGEGRQWAERALAAAPNAPRSLRARALVAAADCSYLGGDTAPRVPSAARSWRSTSWG